ncbi:hypothetical protein CC78DRAFT_279517 [Lojkania enalia]|uniref:Uncharacterized protein n=1 Tax=Lojkania enalia TaxID=147567 RepID=A0A9P4NA33_9PLEO|nr:hypothetical protein CC78DRAFT_279517 [Didymosphaeria enalia]
MVRVALLGLNQKDKLNMIGAWEAFGGPNYLQCAHTLAGCGNTSMTFFIGGINILEDFDRKMKQVRKKGTNDVRRKELETISDQLASRQNRCCGVHFHAQSLLRVALPRHQVGGTRTFKEFKTPPRKASPTHFSYL